MVVRRVSVVIFVALAAVLVAACSSTEKEPTFDTGDGDALAAAMLPDARVFPGSGWKTLLSPEEDEDAGESDACSGLDGAFSDLDERLQEKLDNPAGSAAREYELAGSAAGAAIPVSIELETEIHDDRDALREGITALDSLLHSPEFEECLRDAMRSGATESGGEGISVEVKVANASAAVPRDGSGLGLDARISSGAVSVDVRMELYAWRIGNAAAFVLISGTKNDVTAEFVRNVLDRIDGAALIAAKKK